MGDPEKRKGIKALVCSVNPNIVVFQEVRRAHMDMRFMGSVLSSRFKKWIYLPAVSSGHSNGVAFKESQCVG